MLVCYYIFLLSLSVFGEIIRELFLCYVAARWGLCLNTGCVLLSSSLFWVLCCAKTYISIKCSCSIAWIRVSVYMWSSANCSCCCCLGRSNHCHGIRLLIHSFMFSRKSAFESSICWCKRFRCLNFEIDIACVLRVFSGYRKIHRWKWKRNKKIPNTNLKWKWK